VAGFLAIAIAILALVGQRSYAQALHGAQRRIEVTMKAASRRRTEATLRIAAKFQIEPQFQ
jgi:hypothetical protein